MSLPGQYLKGLVPADLSQCNGAASFLQSGFWGSFKARFGWNVRPFLADWGAALPLMVIRRRIWPGISLAYVPWGPELPPDFPTDDQARTQALHELAAAIQPFLPQNTAFIRFDPPWHTEEDAEPRFPVIDKPFIRAGADVQPPDTVLVDISVPASVILARMKSKWRYNIGLAKKKGVVIHRRDEAGMEVFYALLRKTAKRDRIAIHGIEYYKTLFAHARDYPADGQELRLYLAEHEGEPLAGIIVLFRGADAVYLYGASSDRKRNLMATYGLQWQAMEDAKAAGCLVYDLFGIPPHEDPSHPMSGLYRFKTGFGGRIIHRPGSWDYTYRPLTKGLFNLAESIRKKLRSLKKLRKDEKTND
ncbi:MAG: peptidoglycan bridge formation glycyltransferase FemA/FemB family protein [Treponema sp.]|nr:peptidoglycan bridge formation glycyltransferase FemA/FemB family protein [Treponema sp.]